MELNIDITNKEFVVTKEPTAKLDHNGVQRTEKSTGEPLWGTQVVATDDSGGEIITITTAGPPPDVQRGDLLDVIDLVAIPWCTNGRGGVAYKADSVKAIVE